MKFKIIRGYRVKYCKKHELFDQGFRSYCFVCGTDLYGTRITKRLKIMKGLL